MRCREPSKKELSWRGRNFWRGGGEGWDGNVRPVKRVSHRGLGTSRSIQLPTGPKGGHGEMVEAGEYAIITAGSLGIGRTLFSGAIKTGEGGKKSKVRLLRLTA